LVYNIPNCKTLLAVYDVRDPGSPKHSRICASQKEKPR
jgi:hypothetical protein